MKASRVDSGVDRVRVRALKNAEDARFREARPRSAALLERGRRVMPNGVPMAWMVGSYHHLPLWVESGSGAHFTDVDGHVYRDFNIADLSMFCGYAPEPRRPSGERPDRPRQPVPAAGRGRHRRLGGARRAVRAAQVAVHELGDAREHRGHPRRPRRDRPREGRSCSTASTTATSTRRWSSWTRPEQVVIEERGVPGDTVDGTVLVPFNDPAALARALERRDVAVVLTEPAITNNIGLLLPDDGFHAELRRLTRETGTLLAIDETHTQVFGPGGLTAAWGLEPDLLVAGKSIAGGLPFGAWGMTEAIAELLEQRKGPDGERSNLVATGGTIFGNPLAMAAARAVLTEILVPGGLRAHAAPGRAGSPGACGRRSNGTACRGTSRTSGRAPATCSSRRRSTTRPRAGRRPTSC